MRPVVEKFMAVKGSEPPEALPIWSKCLVKSWIFRSFSLESIWAAIIGGVGKHRVWNLRSLLCDKLRFTPFDLYFLFC